MMEWAYFYDKYSELSDSKLKSYISLLEDIDSGEELVNAVVDIENKDIKALLVRKAMEFNVEFTQDDFYSLDGEIPTDLYVKLAREGNITFGTNDEVAQTLASIFDDAANEALYKRAIKSGVKFTQEQLEWIGKDEEEYESPRPASNNTGCGCLGALLGFGLLFGNSGNSSSHHNSHSGSHSTKKRHNGRCDGDCANCPPHYGYRYGRWYYGHGHNHGCEFGGNKGGGGPD